jgi:hypothetical protein
VAVAAAVQFTNKVLVLAAQAVVVMAQLLVVAEMVQLILVVAAAVRNVLEHKRAVTEDRALLYLASQLFTTQEQLRVHQQWVQTVLTLT